MSTEVIKRYGQRRSEYFSPGKLRSSIEAACLSARTPGGQAEQIATAVAAFVHAWSDERPAITSDDIRRIAHQGLAMFHPDAAYEYQHHQLIM